MAYFSRKGECIIYFTSPVHLSLQLNVTQHPRSPRVLVGVCECTNGALWIHNEMQMLKKALKLKRVPWAFSYRSLSCVPFFALIKHREYNSAINKALYLDYEQTRPYPLITVHPLRQTQ